MQICVLGDTHGHIEYTTQAIREIEKHNVEVVIHCGDIGHPEIVGLFTGKPTHFVFGNVDHDVADLRMAIEQADLTCHERQGDIELGDRRIGFLHGDDGGLLMQMIDSQDFDLICYGHTHEKEVHKEGRTVVLNPGALYRASPHTIAIVDLETMDVEHIVIE